MKNLAAVVSFEAINKALKEAHAKNLELISATKFHIVYKNKFFPPKEIVRLAAKKMRIYDIEDFRLQGGKATNQYLEKMGFVIRQFGNWKSSEQSQRQSVNEERIARLTYNTNKWTSPSGPEGKSKAKSSYETKNGYGHEEWLFDFSKVIDGYHYGFLQPINTNQDKYIGSVFNIYLYTVNNANKEKFWVAKINNVEVIDGKRSKKIKEVYQKNAWFQEMKDELKDLRLDEKTLDQWKGNYLFSVRFKPEDVENYPQGTLISKEDNSICSFHYVLLHLNQEPRIVKEADGQFVLGRCNPERRFLGKSFKKKIEEKIIEYTFLHHQLSRALEKTLKKTFEKVYAEHETGFKTSIDIVAIKDNKKYFYEIKTDNDIKSCIRQAIGQLLENSYYPNKCLAHKLFVVSPHQVNDQRLCFYIENLRAKVKLPIYYMWYDLKNKRIGQII